MKVLWIDDDGDLLEIQTDLLQAEGIDVEVIRDVDTAWRRLNELTEPTAIILDIMMGTGTLLKGTQTNGGVATGQRFLEKMQAEGKLQQHRVMVYSIVDSESISDLCSSLSVPHYSKAGYPGMTIVKLVKDLISSKT